MFGCGVRTLASLERAESSWVLSPNSRFARACGPLLGVADMDLSNLTFRILGKTCVVTLPPPAPDGPPSSERASRSPALPPRASAPARRPERVGQIGP